VRHLLQVGQPADRARTPTLELHIALLRQLLIDAGVTFAEDAVVAIEHRRRSEPFTAETQRLRFSRRAEYGEVWISFFIA